MRRLASFLLLGFSLAAGAAEIWRWTDENGVVHLSDRPMPGAVRIHINDPPPQPTPPTATPVTPAAGEAGTSTARRTPTVAYTSCAVSNPQHDSVFHMVDAVTVTLDVQPAVQEGHSVQVVLNGSPVADWPARETRHVLTGLFRGTYTVAARIVDAGGRAYCNGAAISFHIRQPSVLSPARRQQPQGN